MAYCTPIKHTRVKMNPHRHVLIPFDLLVTHFGGRSVVLGKKGWDAQWQTLTKLMQESTYLKLKNELDRGIIQYIKVERE